MLAVLLGLSSVLGLLFFGPSDALLADDGHYFSSLAQSLLSLEDFGYNSGHSRTLLDCVVLSLAALLFLLLAARRLNRFEREGFVNSWAALGKLRDQADQIAGGQVAPRSSSSLLHPLP